MFPMNTFETEGEVSDDERGQTAPNEKYLISHESMEERSYNE